MEYFNAQQARELAENPQHAEAKESVRCITEKIKILADNGQREHSCYVERYEKDYIIAKMIELGYKAIDTEYTAGGNPILKFKW